MIEANVLLLVGLLTGTSVSHVTAIPFPTLEACEAALMPVATLAKQSNVTSIAVQCRRIDGPAAAQRDFRDEINRAIGGLQR